MSKRCLGCKRLLPLDSFWKSIYTKDGRNTRCSDCRIEIAKEWFAKHPCYLKDRYWMDIEKSRKNGREEARRSREKDPVKYREGRRNYANKKYKNSQEFRKQIRERSQRWEKSNREVVRQIVRNKRARRYGAKGKCSKDQWMERVEYFGWRCWMCHALLTSETLTADHVIPIFRGGTNWPSNLRPACGGCNSSKGAKLPCELS